ncbi:MAG TPA: D-alanyl-D-alanine carboxypeptidase/D-alanyl-D-alanine-endopeptidase [Mycobacteriales bacterium]|nr:D-alanyl-D-alanine carboxypeptidase/D-alanyl-D-alanine-endopeptidase [Mycobacteriales bacterium]
MPARRRALGLLLLAAVVLATACSAAGPRARSEGPGASATTPVPPLLPAVPASGAPQAPLPTTAGLSRTLAARPADPALAGRVSVVVVDPATGATLLDHRGAAPVIPASTAKIPTAVAALTALGPRHRLRTRVVRDPDGTVVLVGGGDPTLAAPGAPPAYPAPARLATLAAATARALGAGATVRVAVDPSRWSGPLTGPGWRPSYLSLGNVRPVRALSVDAGRVRPNGRARPAPPGDPAVAAGRAFAGLLTRGGVPVSGGVAIARAAPDARELAHVDSPPVAALVERMLGTSDNDLAEALGREVALRVGQPPTFAGAAAGIRAVVAGLGVDPGGLRLVDASGLSRDDRLPPRLLARLLTRAAGDEHPDLRAVVTGLPVAGFSGTLRPRYARAPERVGAGVVRAKTGTLLGVSALAGIAVDADGRLLVFALVADGVPVTRTLAAQAALDRTATALATCGCR